MKVPNMQIGITRSQWPRFLVVDADNNYYWTGKEWSKYKNDARLYLTAEEAAEEFASIQKSYFTDKREVFKAQVLIEVMSDEKVDIEELKKWLKSAVVLSVRYGACGTGPGDSLVQLRFDTQNVEREEQ